ncbi:uncharacterized protein LOC109856323 [Pseudomyrmex gracilis]|uniref:uncharacterized protein LOC109856323 n=1 Tax=Pseudomyrmex gracilis TaxID=219809 RepID=UPI000994F42D|nr:uncharacterized protein LOC109856323 [Pseudomyrmex gracilis]
MDEGFLEQINILTNKMDYELHTRVNKLEYILKHLIKILLWKERHVIEFNIPEHELKTTWSVIDEPKVLVKIGCFFDCLDPSCNSRLQRFMMKLFSDNMLCPEKDVSRKLFKNELRVQREILPQIEDLLRANVGPILQYSSDKLKMFFLEDLSNKGYQMKPYDRGLNFSYSVKAIQLMAKFHAASVALHEQNPTLVESFRIDKSLTAESSEHLIQVFHDSMKIASVLINMYYPIIAAKMKMVADRVYTMQQIIDLYNYEPEEFCVLNNGDFSVHNLFFSEEDSNCPSLLQNFQMANYSSPAIDLHHFLNISPETAVIYDQDEQLLHMYLTILCNTMNALNCKTKPPTMEQLKAAMRKRELYAVFVGVTFKLNMVADKIEEDEENSDYGKNPYEELVKKMCLTMFHKKYFNCI